MGTKSWTIEFGWNFEKKSVVAETVEQAIEKAWEILKKEYGKKFKKETEDYWIRKVECEIETDD
jgi:hypothetical protein